MPDEFGIYSGLFEDEQPLEQPTSQVPEDVGEYGALFDTQPQSFQDYEGQTFETKEDLLSSLNQKITEAQKKSSGTLGKALGPVTGVLRAFPRSIVSIAGLMSRMDAKTVDDMIERLRAELEEEQDFQRAEQLQKQLDNAIAAAEVHRGKAERLGEIRESDFLRDLPFERAETKAGQFAQDVSAGIPQLAVSVAAGATLGPIGGTAALGSLIAGSQIEELEEKGVPDERIARSVAVNAPIQGFLEWSVGKYLGKAAGKVGLGKVAGVVEGTVGEFLEEFTQEYPQEITNKWAIENEGFLNAVDKTIKDPETLKHAAYAGLIGLTLGGGLTTIGGASNYLYRKDVEKDLIDKIMERPEITDREQASTIAKDMIKSRDEIKKTMEELQETAILENLRKVVNESPELVQAMREQMEKEGVKEFTTGIEMIKFFERNKGLRELAVSEGERIQLDKEKGEVTDAEEEIKPEEDVQAKADEVTEVEQAPEEISEEKVELFAEDFDSAEDFNDVIQNNLDEGNTSVVKALLKNLSPEERTELKSLRQDAKQAPVEEVTQEVIPKVKEEVKAPEEAPTKPVAISEFEDLLTNYGKKPAEAQSDEEEIKIFDESSEKIAEEENAIDNEINKINDSFEATEWATGVRNDLMGKVFGIQKVKKDRAGNIKVWRDFIDKNEISQEDRKKFTKFVDGLNESKKKGEIAEAPQSIISQYGEEEFDIDAVMEIVRDIAATNKSDTDRKIAQNKRDIKALENKKKAINDQYNEEAEKFFAEQEKREPKPDAATVDFTEFEKWEIREIKNATQGMTEAERVDWIAENGARLRKEFDRTHKASILPKKRKFIPLSKEQKKAKQERLEENERLKRRREAKEKRRPTSEKKIKMLKEIASEVVVFDKRKHKELINTGLAKEVEIKDKKKKVIIDSIELTDKGMGRLAELEEASHKKKQAEFIGERDEELEAIVSGEEDFIERSVDEATALIEPGDIIKSYYDFGKPQEQKIRPSKKQIDDVGTFFDKVAGMFPKGKVLLRMGDADNNISSFDGTVLENFSAGNYGSVVINKNGDAVVMLNTGLKNPSVGATIIHEVVGHYGVNTLFEMDSKLEKHARELFEREQNTPLVKAIEKVYSKDEVFYEWFAKIIEDRITPLFNRDGTLNEQKFGEADKTTRSIWQKIKDFFRRIFGKNASEAELNEAAFTIFRDLSKITPEATKKAQRVQNFLQKLVPEKEVQKVEKRKEKRKAAKKKIHKFTEDLVKAQIEKDVVKAKVRYAAFAEKHLTQSQRNQLMEMVNKIKTIADMKKINDLVEKFQHYRSIDELNTLFKKIDPKDNVVSKVRNLTRESNAIKEIFQDLKDQETLQRLSERGKVRRPFKRGTTETTQMGERYARLHKEGYIVNDAKKKGRDELHYEITDKGKEQLKVLNSENETMLDELDDRILKFRIEVNDKKEEISGIKDKKKEKRGEAISDGIASINKFNKRKVIKNPLVRRLINMFQSSGEHVATRIDGFTNVDRNGFQQGAITDNLINVGQQGRNEMFDYQRKSSNFVMKEIKSNEKKAGLKIDMSKFSESTHFGLLDRTSDIVRKIPVLRKALEGKIGRGVVKRFTYKVKDGTLTLNKAQRVTLYLMSLNNDSRRHMTEGGVKLKKEEQAIKLSPTEIEKIANDVRQSPEEMAVAKAVFKFFNTIQKETLNDVSNKNLGFDIATVEDYFPIMVAPEVLQKLEEGFKDVKDFEAFKTNVQEFIRETTPGMLKSRVESKKPIYIDDVFQVLARNNSVVSKYVGFSGKINEMTNFLEGIKQPMIEAGLEADFNTLKDYIASFMGGVGNGPERIMRKMIGLYSVKALGLPNIKVPLKQLPSAFAALPYLDSRAWDEIVKMTPSRMKRTKEEMLEHSAYFEHRNHSVIDGDMLESFKEKEARRFFESGRSMSSYISAEGLMSGIHFFDFGVIENIWSATKKDIELNNPDIKVGSDEYWKLVDRKAQQIVRWTQPTFEPETRTRAQKSLVLKPFTWFSTQRVKYSQQLEKAVTMILDKEAPKKFKRQGFGILLNVVTVNAMFMTMLDYSWLLLRGRLGDKEKRQQTILFGILKNLAGVVPVLDKLVNSVLTKLQGFDRPDITPGLQIFTDAVDTIFEMIKKEKKTSFRKRTATGWKKTKNQRIKEKALKTIGNFGIPFQSADDYIEIYKNAMDELE